MDQKIVKNSTGDKVCVMYDGLQVEFEPDESKLFSAGVANFMTEQDASLVVVDSVLQEVSKEEVKEEVTVEPVDEEVEKTEEVEKPKRKYTRKTK